MTTYPIFTLSDGYITRGATVQTFRLSGGQDIPALLIGENGRGRRLGVLPVAGATPDCEIRAAAIGTTRAGRPKLIANTDEDPTTNAAILIFREPIGFRGSKAPTASPSRKTARSWPRVPLHRAPPAAWAQEHN